MPHTSRIWIILIVVASTLNLAILVRNISVPARAAIGGMDARTLMADPDFTNAVKSIVGGCRVNLDVAKISC
jgi:hypothetical protein